MLLALMSPVLRFPETVADPHSKSPDTCASAAEMIPSATIAPPQVSAPATVASLYTSMVRADTPSAPTSPVALMSPLHATESTASADTNASARSLSLPSVP